MRSLYRKYAFRYGATSIVPWTTRNQCEFNRFKGNLRVASQTRNLWESLFVRKFRGVTPELWRSSRTNLQPRLYLGLTAQMRDRRSGSG